MHIADAITRTPVAAAAAAAPAAPTAAPAATPAPTPTHTIRAVPDDRTPAGSTQARAGATAIGGRPAGDDGRAQAPAPTPTPVPAPAPKAPTPAPSVPRGEPAAPPHGHAPTSPNAGDAPAAPPHARTAGKVVEPVVAAPAVATGVSTTSGRVLGPVTRPPQFPAPTDTGSSADATAPATGPGHLAAVLHGNGGIVPGSVLRGDAPQLDTGAGAPRERDMDRRVPREHADTVPGARLHTA